MRSTLLAATIAAALPLTLAATTASAQPTRGPAAGTFSFSLSGGADFVVDGDVHGGVSAPVADLGGLNPALAGVAATLEIGSRSYDDVYGELWGFEAGIGYGLSDTGELFVNVTYSEASGGQLQVGTAVVPALPAELPVFGTFGDFSAWGVEAGYRQYFAARSAFRPYAAVRGGIQMVDSINASFTIPDAEISLQNLPFYDSSEVFTAGLDIGFVYAFTDTIEIGAQAGISYADSLSGDDSAIGGLGLGSINNEGDRFAIPVRAVLRARF